MKKFIILLITIVLVSCTSLETLYKIEKESLLYGVDLRQYSDKGFLITTEMYPGAYESVGIFTYELYPEVDYKGAGYTINYTDAKGNPHMKEVYKWVGQPIEVQEAIDSLYHKCLDMGADAFVKLNIEQVSKPYTGIKNPISLSGISVKGFAIKRLD